MRHRKASQKFNRTTSHRLAMFRNMVTSLFKHERIQTTGARAKELRRLAEHLITLAKRGDLHARRQALAIVREKGVVHKLFDEVDNKFGKSSGGYTRIIKLGRRAGDAAPMSLIELIVPQTGVKKKTKKKAAKQAAAKAKADTQKVADAEPKGEKKAQGKKEKKVEVKKSVKKKTTAKDTERKAKPAGKKRTAATSKGKKTD